MTATQRPSARCRALLLEVSRYLDGDLTPARRKLVARHIADCGCCGTLARRLALATTACRAQAAVPPPKAVQARAAARVRTLIALAGTRPTPSKTGNRHARRTERT